MLKRRSGTDFGEREKSVGNADRIRNLLVMLLVIGILMVCVQMV